MRDGLVEAGLANIYRLLGDKTRSDRTFQSAIDKLSSLASEFPDQPQYRRHLANALNFRGVLLKPSDLSQAEACYTEALGIQEQLVREFPEVRNYRQEYARSTYNRGIVFSERDQPEEANAAFESAITQLQQLIQDDPDNEQYRQELARCENNVGNLLRSTDPDRSTAAFESAIEIMTPTVVDPSRREYAYELATYLNNCSNHLLHNSQDEAGLREASEKNGRAIELFEKLITPVPKLLNEYANTLISRRAVLSALAKHAGQEQPQSLKSQGGAANERAAELFQKLVEDYPDTHVYRDRLGIALYNQGFDQCMAEEYEQGLQTLRSAIEHHTAVWRSVGNQEFALHLRNDYYVYLAVLVMLNNHAEVDSIAAELSMKMMDDVDAQWIAAKAMLKCLPLLEEADEVDPSERQAYVEAVWSLIERAAELGFDLKTEQADENSPLQLLPAEFADRVKALIESPDGDEAEGA
jgi:tetratricopeptide (TPR) repeat protein